MNDQALEIFKTAMLLEDEGAAYYLHQSNQWHETQVSENFKMLAAEERLHHQWLSELFEEKKSFGDTKLLSFMKDHKSPKIFDWTGIKRRADLNVKAVFKKVMDMEEASYQYYTDIKSMSSDEQLNHLLEILIQWEKSHYQTLKKVYDSLDE